MDDMMQKLAKQMEDQLFSAITGPSRKQRQTALRARGNGFETVELDDDGKIIEPPRCICGGAIYHANPRCPFYYVIT